MSDDRLVILDMPHGDLTSERWDVIREILREYALRLSKVIHFCVPHSDVTRPSKMEGKLFVRCWSTPVRTRRAAIPTAYGIPLTSSQSDAIEPSGLGLPIVDPQGHTLAELVDDTLYILFDLIHGGENLEVLMRHVMEGYVKACLPDDPEERRALEEEMLRRQHERSRQIYAQLMQKVLRGRLEYFESDVEDAEMQIRRAEAKIIDQIARRNSARRFIEVSRAVLDGDLETTAAKYDALANHVDVKGVVVTDEYLEVNVGQIDIEYRETVYDIGEFKIRFNLYGSRRRSGLKCFNTTRTVAGGYHHPHVNSDGDCCLGNLATDVAKLIGECEFEVAITILIEFLKSVSTDDWYKNIDNWPVKRVEEEAETEEEPEIEEESETESADSSDEPEEASAFRRRPFGSGEVEERETDDSDPLF